MPAKKKECEYCNQIYWAARSDSKWCSEKCRYGNRAESAKFEVPEIPRSGVPGVTFKRSTKQWIVHLRREGWQKYIGAFKRLDEAVRFLQQVEGDRGANNKRGCSQSDEQAPSCAA